LNLATPKLEKAMTATVAGPTSVREQFTGSACRTTTPAETQVRQPQAQGDTGLRTAPKSRPSFLRILLQALAAVNV
jgi:hypothetical protein